MRDSSREQKLFHEGALGPSLRILPVSSFHKLDFSGLIRRRRLKVVRGKIVGSGHRHTVTVYL